MSFGRPTKHTPLLNCTIACSASISSHFALGAPPYHADTDLAEPAAEDAPVKESIDDVEDEQKRALDEECHNAGLVRREGRRGRGHGVVRPVT